jgi:hypothetical protein
LEKQQDVTFEFLINPNPPNKYFLLKQVDVLDKHMRNLKININDLKNTLSNDIYSLEDQPHIPVPPNKQYEIQIGLLGIWREIFLKTRRNPCLTDADLEQMMGMTHTIESLSF